MPRGRMISRKIRTSQTFAKLTYRQRDLWQGLIEVADDQGRLPGTPASVRSDVWRYDDISLSDVNDDLNVLEELGNIIRYSIDGNDYIQIKNWHIYQSDAQWLGLSEYPAPLGWVDHARYHAKGDANTVATLNWETRDIPQEYIPSEVPSQLPSEVPSQLLSAQGRQIDDVNVKEDIKRLKDCEIEKPISRAVFPEIPELIPKKKSKPPKEPKPKLVPSDPNYWKFLKENESIGKIFYQSTKLFPVEKQFGLWVKDCAAFQEAGIDPEIIPKAVSYMNEQKLSIKSPGSILTVARQIMNNNNKPEDTGWKPAPRPTNN